MLIKKEKETIKAALVEFLMEKVTLTDQGLREVGGSPANPSVNKG